MDKSAAASNAVRLIHLAENDSELRPGMIKAVCSYFDLMKGETLSLADKLFMHFLANKAGIPQYYFPMLTSDDNVGEDISMQTFSNYVQESSFVVGKNVTLHRYQKEVLDRFDSARRNRYFLSAATSFGKTFLIYEIVRKMNYKNIVFIFPTISLLSENLFKIYTSPTYQWIKDRYTIHMLSDKEELESYNLYIFTPERYLSFLDKNKEIHLDFVFVDEVYKLDNSFIIDEVAQENERDVAYRIALHELLKNDDSDALLVGPYIPIPSPNDVNARSSFKEFLNWYGFEPIDYNLYDIVNKEQVIIKPSSRKILVDESCQVDFPQKNKKSQVLQLVDRLLNIGENTIIYCNQRSLVENWAKFLLNNMNQSLQDIVDDRVVRLASHIENLFADGKGADWIVLRALKKGIGIHHGLVPKYIQQEIINLFNNGILKVLVCTTTITEGVNTTAKNMIVLSGKKGDKRLKKFDALNIEGRAGRFMKHYKGRVFILDKKFLECMDGVDESLKHKLFEKDSEKQDVDILFSESLYLTEGQVSRRENLEDMKVRGVMPEACFEEFKMIPYDDKYLLYQEISAFSESDLCKIKDLIRYYVSNNRSYRPGLELICQSIRPIVRNKKLQFYVENGDASRANCYLVDMISAFVAKGFSGSANYYINKENNVDIGIRKAADFVFNILRYQVVKYFGLFNMLYKQCEAQKENQAVDEVIGIDALLLRLEYGASTQLGRRASDVGASFRVVEYYDLKEKFSGNKQILESSYNRLDDFEKYNVSRINKILEK